MGSLPRGQLSQKARFASGILSAVPEGPEIRRAAEGLDAALARRKAQEVVFAFEHLRPFEAELSGRRIRRVESRGKAILVFFSGGWAIYTHNQLYGRWYVEPAGLAPDTGRSLRLAVRTRERSALLYSASEIEVLRDEELAAHSYLARLGPDVLAPATTAVYCRASAKSPCSMASLTPGIVFTP